MFRIIQLCVFRTILYFLYVSDVSTLPPYEPYKILFENEKGMMTYNDGSLSIYCSNDQIHMTDAFQPINASINFSGVYIGQCSLSNTTYFDELESLNINTAALIYLTHSVTLNKPLPSGNYTEGLKITHLVIANKNYYHFLENTPNFLDPLSNLKSIYVANADIPPLPTTMNIINLTLSNGATIKDWGNCLYIERFDMSSFKEKNFPIWPQNCTRLEYFELARMLPETALMIAERMIAAAPSLRTLKITYCRLHRLPIELLKNAKNLVYLDLSDNALYDEALSPFPYLPSLKTLDLSINLIRGYGLGELVQKLPGLLKLILKNENEFVGDEEGCLEGSRLKNGFMKPLQNSSVETVVLSYSTIHLICFKDIRFLNMKNIYLDHSPGSNGFKLLHLPKTDAGHLYIDFGYTDVEEILFDKGDYETLRKENASSPYNRRNLTVILRYVTCDCKHGWLARALRDFPHIISMPTLKCEHEYGIEILEEPTENLECDKMEQDDGCVYTRSWSDGKMTAECYVGNWTEIEFMYPLHGLNVSGQGISTLPSKWPDNLQWLDLRRNRLARATSQEATVLFTAGRRVWLADNLLLCDCDNRAFLDAIQFHKEQVPDYDLLKCVGTGESLSLVSTDVLCQVPMIASLTVCGILILIAGLIALLLRRYGEKIRMFLYSRGWCIRCLQRQDPDDKPYDAFLSFAHEDQEYVMGTLLPGLENAPEQFRVCVHYRDWLVGDWIPAQIMRSVQLSKRTLILLSKNFAVSAWSNLELRCALANAAQDNNSKVLVLVKDDVLDMNLDIELKGYLMLNTYLCCNDPWFWEKLRYAMPHRLKQKHLENEEIKARNTIALDVAKAFPNSIGNAQEVSV